MSSSFHFQSHPLSNPRKIEGFVTQEKYWVNANFEQVRIKDMDLSYVVAAMTWLVKRAPEVKLALELYYRVHEAPEAHREWDLMHSEQWIKQTRLFQKFLSRFDKLSEYQVAKPKIADIEAFDEEPRPYGG